jgi:hypothetical protein
MTKSVITIEETFLDFQGVPCVRRVIKENDVIYYKDAVKVSDVSKICRKLDSFDMWFDDIKHPEIERVYRNPFSEDELCLVGSKKTKDQFCEDLQLYCESLGL